MTIFQGGFNTRTMTFLISPQLNFKVINPNEHPGKDNSIKDYYDNWSIEATCDTITLESSHPFKPPRLKPTDGPTFGMFYTHECKGDEIAYFKVDVNLISLPYSYLGNV